jgi:ABC-type dipeptide/oligopeptide/nickel transport system ATPase component
MPLLEIKDLKVRFVTEETEFLAVDRISFSINKGETVALVGESGSGKSVSALSLARLIPTPPAFYDSGQILLEGKNVLEMPPRELREIRGGKIAYIFQEPSTSLNPVFSIRNQIAESIRLHRKDVSDVNAEILELLKLVGIRDPARVASSYPHELSGGMQQRVMIAMAIACHPSLLIADEPTTALDVTIQAQILDLLRELREKLGMAILLITHNFAIVGNFADRVLVMYRGKIVEQGTVQEVLHHPQHPYTKALLACIPKLGAHRKRLATIDHAVLQAASKS